MPNLKNAKKQVLINKKKEIANNEFSASMKTAIKNVERAVNSKDKDKACEKLKVAIKVIDKATQKGVTSKNTSARNKSRLSKKVNSME
ncbi:MAG: 30S ribosomal protein S20 [bacterium]|nr:30S ribosomal protein S20 [bacterium]